MGSLLFRDDYKKAVETCEYQRSGFGVKSFVDDFLKAYQDHNSDMISELMEYVLDVFPEVEDQPEILDFYKKDIVNFKEEAGRYDRPQLQYLHSYLIHLDDTEAQMKSDKDPTIPLKSEPVKSSISNSVLNTFTTNLDDEDLREVSELLVKHKYIDPISFDDFKRIFNAVLTSEIKTKIRWIKSYQKGNMHNKSFFFFLHSILSEADFVNPDLCKVIAHCFIGPDGQELGLSKLEKAYNEFDIKRVVRGNAKPIPHLSKILEPFQRHS